MNVQHQGCQGRAAVSLILEGFSSGNKDEYDEAAADEEFVFVPFMNQII